MAKFTSHIESLKLEHGHGEILILHTSIKYSWIFDKMTLVVQCIWNHSVSGFERQIVAFQVSIIYRLIFSKIIHEWTMTVPFLSVKSYEVNAIEPSGSQTD